MSDEIKCPKCTATMQRGFILDPVYGTPPLKGEWVTGVNTRWSWISKTIDTSNATPIEIVTLRCPTCGFLESYAPPPKTT